MWSRDPWECVYLVEVGGRERSGLAGNDDDGVAPDNSRSTQ